MKEVLNCYVGRTYNGNPPEKHFFRMPESGTPNIIRYGQDYYFDDKSVEKLIPSPLADDLMKRLNQTSSRPNEGNNLTARNFYHCAEYCWMRFDLIIESKSFDEPASHKDTICMDVSREKMEDFLREIRKKRETDLFDLEQRFLYFFDKDNM